MLLRNHGPVVIGHSRVNAFSLLWLLTRACERPLASAAMGRMQPHAAASSRRQPMAEPVLAGCVRNSRNFDPRFGAGQDAFDALQRLIDRRDPSYRA